MIQRGQRPTIVDVAHAAGVGRTTASDALNGHGRVDGATRERVRDAAARLGYRANLAARSLRAGRTGILALLLPPMEPAGEESQALGLDFYTRLTSTVAAAAFVRRYAVVLVPPLERPEQIRNIPFDGAIVNDPTPGDELLALLDSDGVPVVTIERDPARRDDTRYVATDSDHNTRIALDHLAERGARRISLLVPAAEWSWTTEMIAAYRQWCHERAVEPSIVPVPLRHLEGSAHSAAIALLSGTDPPDAILAGSDYYALGALRAAGDLSIRVPEQLKIVAAVDSHANAEVTPGITAIELHPERYATVAAGILIAELTGERASRAQRIRGDLVPRRSTLG